MVTHPIKLILHGQCTHNLKSHTQSHDGHESGGNSEWLYMNVGLVPSSTKAYAAYIKTFFHMHSFHKHEEENILNLELVHYI